jgi:seryl-tRNA synthetase
MLELNVIRENPQQVIDRLALKHFDASEAVKQILELDVQRRETQKQLDDNLAESNAIAREVGNLFKSGKQAEAAVLKNRSAELKVLAKNLGDHLEEIQKSLNDILVTLPNLPHPTTPPGRHAEDNPVVLLEAEMPVLPKEPCRIGNLPRNMISLILSWA